ncbi:MAG: hypothetical protein GW938_07005 [Leptospira sp.]|nr:hypothetical protein [Leptospira sp.]NCS95392.1 hypothetical protein [Leptospira sp.]
MPSRNIWKYLNLTEENIFQKEFGIFNYNQPKEFHQESIAFRLHSFCYYFINKNFPNYKQPNQRKEIESLVWNFYYQQAFNIRTLKPEFKCLSSNSEISNHIQINFQLDADLGFLPFKWETFSKNNLISIGIDEYHIGKITSLTEFEPSVKNCVKNKTQDTNRNGIPDIWYKFENCKLITHKEDFNENGNFERRCFYKNDGIIDFCEGLGEKNLSLARGYEEKEEWNQSIFYYNKLIEEYNSEFKGYSRHICEPNYKILQFHYNLMNYATLNERYKSLKSNPYCNNYVKKSQIFLGFINLYSLHNWSDGVDQLEEANKTYKEEKGWDSIEINLALSYGYLNLQKYSSCLDSLQKIAGRPFNQKGRYFYNYYFGSCKLGASDFQAALPALRIALDSAKDSNEKSIVYFKLGILFLSSGISSDQKNSERYFHEAIRLNPNLLTVVEKARKEHKESKDFSDKP